MLKDPECSPESGSFVVEPPRVSNQAKFLVISFAGIGDTLFATPLIHELRANFPDAKIDALVRWPGSRDVLLNNPHVNSVYQKNLIKANKIEAFSFLALLQKHQYD